MNLTTVPVTVVSNVRRSGWRGALRDGSRTVWRCHCREPHGRPELASACATEALGRRGSGFYPGGYDMDEWVRAPQTDEERQALVAAIQSLPRETTDAAINQLVLQRMLIDGDTPYEKIRQYQGAAESIRLMYRANKDVRNEYDRTFLVGEWRIGQALLREEAEGLEATGTRGQLAGSSGGNFRVTPETRNEVTIAEKVGNRMYGWRLKTVGALPSEALSSAINEIHQRDKEATLTGIVKILRSEEAAMRRLDTLTTPPLEDGYSYRIGDCRVMLSDIEDNSVPLILTDPPYGHDGLVLYEWLAEFAARVLIPGGSLVCYTGQGLLQRDLEIFSQHLNYRWTFAMMHNASQKMLGATVFAKWKPVLWFVKGRRREPCTLIPDVIYSRRDKSEHDWSQGSGGINQWIHHLTLPFETVVDPFAGTGEWGEIVCGAGRYWIGCDVVFGGTTQAEVGEVEENVEVDG